MDTDQNKVLKQYPEAFCIKGYNGYTIATGPQFGCCILNITEPTEDKAWATAAIGLPVASDDSIDAERLRLGKRIKTYRKELELTQSQLCDQLGCTLVELGRMERGQMVSEGMLDRSIQLIGGTVVPTDTLAVDALLQSGDTLAGCTRMLPSRVTRSPDLVTLVDTTLVHLLS